MPSDVKLLDKFNIILPQHDRRMEGCPFCYKIDNPLEGDLFEFCEKHFDEFVCTTNQKHLSQISDCKLSEASMSSNVNATPAPLT